MADQNPKEMHFKQVFGYIVSISIIVLGYVIAVTFLPIPKDNSRFVDISFGFLLNFLANAAAYLIGGNPVGTPKKTEPEEPADNKDPQAPIDLKK